MGNLGFCKYVSTLLNIPSYKTLCSKYSKTNQIIPNVRLKHLVENVILAPTKDRQLIVGMSD